LFILLLFPFALAGLPVFVQPGSVQVQVLELEQKLAVQIWAA
jgi:hypothetical protein